MTKDWRMPYLRGILGACLFGPAVAGLGYVFCRMLGWNLGFVAVYAAAGAFLGAMFGWRGWRPDQR